MKKIPFAVVKMVNIVLLMIPFLICWTLHYEPRTTTVGSKQVSVLVMITYFLICYYFEERLDCFRVSILQIRDAIFGEVLATMITDIIMYILIWMLSIHLPNLIPGLITWGGQCVIGVIWAFVMHQSYFSTHPPLRTIVIYDERMGMENLIHTYGLEKRFNIKTVYPVESIMDKLEVMEEFDAAFLCGIHSRERNIILKHCINHKIKLFMIPRIADVMMRGSEQIHMLHLPILKTQRYKPSIEYQIIKRTMDIVVSGIATIVLSPLFLITAIAVKSDGGPAFYKQKRLTKDGKVFEILKFRSMRVDAEKYSGAVLSAGENDPRITKVGRIIRACRLDDFLRGSLEKLAIQKSNCRLSDYSLMIMEASIEDFRKAVLAGNTMKAVHADETFHLQIIHSAQLNRLTKMWELLSPLNGAMFLSVQNANRLEPNTPDPSTSHKGGAAVWTHQCLLEAIRINDLQATCDLLDQHYEETGRRVYRLSLMEAIGDGD